MESERLTAAEFYETAEHGDFVELTWTHEPLRPARGVFKGAMLTRNDAGDTEVIVVLNYDSARFKLPESAGGRILQRAADRKRDGFGFRRR